MQLHIDIKNPKVAEWTKLNVMKYFCFGLFILLFISCDQPSAVAIEEKDPGLKDYYSEYFLVGASVTASSFSGFDSTIIVNEYNSITAENLMKMEPIHPEPDEYHWKDADAMVAFADEHGIKMRGHTLCWHNQAPAWMFEGDEGKTASKEQLLERLKEHITAVAGRYKGKIFAWDVVNEVISDSEDEYMRSSQWYNITGEEYIRTAFKTAHEIDPDAKLFYNDYNATQPAKRDKIIKMIKSLQDDGIPIHGMGLQAHWSIHHPTEDELRAALDAYSALGLDIHITELDVSVYAHEPGGTRNKRDDEADDFTPEMEQAQMDQYEMFFRVFRDYRDDIQSVTFWNISDRYSWLDFFPVRGRKNYPLLFDQEGQRKKAYDKVVNFEASAE